MTAQTEAIANMTKAIAGLKQALDKLNKASAAALAEDERKIFALTGKLNEQLVVTETLLRHMQAAEVVVTRPPADAYASLEAALTELQATEVETAGLGRLLTVASALGNSIKSTSAEFPARA